MPKNRGLSALPVRSGKAIESKVRIFVRIWWSVWMARAMAISTSVQWAAIRLAAGQRTWCRGIKPEDIYQQVADHAGRRLVRDAGDPRSPDQFWAQQLLGAKREPDRAKPQ